MSQFNPKFLEEIKEYDPELYNAVNGVADLASAEGALDPKTKFLIGAHLLAFFARKKPSLPG